MVGCAGKVLMEQLGLRAVSEKSPQKNVYRRRVCASGIVEGVKDLVLDGASSPAVGLVY